MLPELPKKNNKKEADFGLKFRKWIEANPLYTASFEMKHTDGKDYLNLSEIKTAQVNFGRLIQSDKGVLIRLKGVEGLPDYMYVREEAAFVVIKYPDFFAIIDIHFIAFEKERAKSLSSLRAKQIAWRIIA